jgi:HK97 family phage major capsid protein
MPRYQRKRRIALGEQDQGLKPVFCLRVAPRCLINCIRALRVGYRAGSNWVMNPLTFATVMQVKDLQGRPIVTPSLIAGQPDMLLGFPIVLADGMPVVGTGNIAILFGNFRRGYVIIDRIQM